MRLVLAAILSMIATGTWSSPVIVRSGDHDDFTRLVLEIVPGTNWEMGRYGAGYELVLNADQGFDISRSFDRITRDRIVELFPGANSIKIELACECHAKPSLYEPNLLVIDIEDGRAPIGSPFEVALAERRPAPIPPPSLPSNVEVSLGDDLMPNPFEVASFREERVNGAENAIVESVARAATQGLLELSIEFETNIQSSSFTLPDGAAQGTRGFAEPVTIAGVAAMSKQEALGILEAFPDPLLGIRTQTTLERDATSDSAKELAVSGAVCIDDAMVAFADWAKGNDFATEIGPRLEALTDQAGDLQEQSVVDLAKAYLYFGFGREAAGVLTLDGARSMERDILGAIAGTIDEDITSGPTLSDQLGCVGSIALWSALARRSLTGAGEPERTAMIMAQKALPEPIRDQIGTLLAQLFLDAGDPAAAEEILDGRSAAFQTTTPDLTLIEVIETVDGPEAALNELELSLEGHPRTSPEAFVKLLELTVTGGDSLESGSIDLADALRFENRGTEGGEELTIASVDAMIAEQKFKEAIEFISGASSSPDDQLRAELEAKVIIAMAQQMDDGPFLEFAFGDLPANISDAAANAVSSRLIVLGFTEKANELVAEGAQGAAMAERRFVRAEAAYAEGRDAEGSEILSGILDPRADNLTQRYRATGTALQSDTEVSAWRAGDWAALATGDDPDLRDAASDMLEAGPQALQLETLAERRSLIEEAEATRRLAESLLARFTLVPGETDAASP